MNPAYLDLESRSVAPIKKTGAHLYAEHETTEDRLRGAVDSELYFCPVCKVARKLLTAAPPSS